jgi:hypothetical protein
MDWLSDKKNAYLLIPKECHIPLERYKNKISFKGRVSKLSIKNPKTIFPTISLFFIDGNP